MLMKLPLDGNIRLIISWNNHHCLMCTYEYVQSCAILPIITIGTMFVNWVK